MGTSVDLEIVALELRDKVSLHGAISIGCLLHLVNGSSLSSSIILLL